MAADLTGIADKQLRRLVEGLVADGWKVRRGRHGVLVLCPCSSTDGRSPHGFTVGGTVNDKGRRRANIEAAARRCAAARDTDQRQTCYTYLAGGNRRKESPPMKVAIIGPNLYDQTKGTFHVHTASCRDGKNGRKYPLAYRHEIDTDSQFDVAESVYSDHAGDYGYQPGDAEYDEYIADTVSDFHFHGCVADLPARAAKEAPA